ncbi:helix-turn-helix domain-containing protein [Bacillus sp. UNC41MFS5]|uniref:helix-turn-helix domain-containing protein n=1 Tax=Bacillus sp. UNC41MFS5 TaxID=1449046 RepID=UPI00047DF379|nr:helix-turn-helix transcriptional regulator [Bacillus sp. UNC41MFS5]
MNEANKRIRAIFIKKLEDNGLKMKFVAEKVGIEYTTLSKWKNGVFNFAEDKLKKIAYFLEQLED